MNIMYSLFSYKEFMTPFRASLGIHFRKAHWEATFSGSFMREVSAWQCLGELLGALSDEIAKEVDFEA